MMVKHKMKFKAKKSFVEKQRQLKAASCAVIADKLITVNSVVEA